LALGPAIFDRDAAALDVADVAQPLLERAHDGLRQVRRFAVEKPDHRHRRLLRAGRDWPSSSRTTEQRD